MANTDNTEKEKGFCFQSLYALKIYFENSQNSDYMLGYEKDGDITLWEGNRPISYFECKHHKDDTNLTTGSQDFWKTIKNIYQDFSNSEMPTFENYYLVTTETQKIVLEKAEDIGKRNEEEVKLYNFVTETVNSKGELYFDIEYDENILTEVLKRFKIIDKQPKLDELLERLFIYFTTIPNKINRKRYILNISTDIDKGTLFDSDNDRKISFSSLSNSILTLASSYNKTDTILENPCETYEVPVGDNIYINKLEIIGLNHPDILMSVRKDYLYTMYNKIETLNEPSLFTFIEDYEKEILNVLKVEKAMNNTMRKNQIENYSSSIDKVEKSSTTIRGVSTNEKYNRGTSHYLVDTKQHDWEYDEIE